MEWHKCRFSIDPIGLGRGDVMLIHPYMLFLFTVPILSSTHHLGECALQVVLATVATVTRTGCHGQGELNGTSSSSLLSLREYSHEEPT